MTENAAALPLEGMRVIELGHSVAAPYAGLILAELGAEVIKIERPERGDDARGWGPPFHDGMSTVFHALNRNKKSVQIDLKSEQGRRTIVALAEGADVFLQNLRPGHADRLGFGYDALHALNPRLVYASIGAFGEAGPLAGHPGYDPLMQAFGGIMSVTGEEGRPSVRAGVSIIDMGSAIWIVLGIVTALLRRAETGKGSEVATSLFETSLAWMTYHLAAVTQSGQQPKKVGSGVAMIVPYQAFATTNGEIVVAAGNDMLFKRLCTVLERSEWASDPRYLTNGDRVQHRDVLCNDIAAIIETGTTETWTARLEEAGIPSAPVQTVAEVASHPQTEALDILRGADETLRAFGLPLTFDGHRPDRDEVAPKLGQDDAMLDSIVAPEPSPVAAK